MRQYQERVPRRPPMASSIKQRVFFFFAPRLLLFYFLVYGLRAENPVGTWLSPPTSSDILQLLLWLCVPVPWTLFMYTCMVMRLLKLLKDGWCGPLDGYSSMWEPFRCHHVSSLGLGKDLRFKKYIYFIFFTDYFNYVASN